MFKIAKEKCENCGQVIADGKMRHEILFPDLLLSLCLPCAERLSRARKAEALRLLKKKAK